LIVAHYSRKRLGWAAAQIVEIELRNEGGQDIVLAMPTEARRIKDAAFEFYKPHGAEPEFPQRARGMQQIQMRRQLWHSDGARHRETALKERPIKRLSIEGDKHGPLGDTLR